MSVIQSSISTCNDIWTPLADLTSSYSYKLEEKKDFAGRTVKLIQESSDPGEAQGKEDWRSKFKDKEAMIQQVKTELHYWYGEGYGSERRKKPAYPVSFVATLFQILSKFNRV